MGELIAIAIGGAVGAVSRYWLTQLAAILFSPEFPYGILIVNLIGSLAIGVLFVLLVERSLLPPIWRSILMVGFLGAFTTFSTFSLQALDLSETGRLIAAAAYVGISVVGLQIVRLHVGLPILC